MAITDKKGINVTSGFKLISPAPIDARYVVEDETELQSIIDSGAAYNGLEVWVNSISKKKQYNGTGFVDVQAGISEEKVVEIVDEKVGDIDAVLDEINGGGTIGGSSSIEVAIEFSVETTATAGKYKLTQITPFADWYKVKDAKITMKGTGENLYEIQSRLPNINGMFNQTTHEAMAFGFSSMYAASDTPSFATFSYTVGTNDFTYKVTGDFLYQVDTMLGLGVTTCTLIVTI